MPRTTPILDRLIRAARTRLAAQPRPRPAPADEPPSPRGATPDPYDAPPTIEELEAAGVAWEPLDDDEASRLEIARDNGYVVLRDPDAPGRPPLVLDEAEWESALDGDDTYDPGREWFA